MTDQFSVGDRLSEHYHLYEKDLSGLGEFDPGLIEAVHSRVRDLTELAQTGSDDDLDQYRDEADAIGNRLSDIVEMRIGKIIRFIIPAVFGEVEPDTTTMSRAERELFESMVTLVRHHAEDCHVIPRRDPE